MQQLLGYPKCHKCGLSQALKGLIYSYHGGCYVQKPLMTPDSSEFVYFGRICKKLNPSRVSFRVWHLFVKLGIRRHRAICKTKKALYGLFSVWNFSASWQQFFIHPKKYDHHLSMQRSCTPQNKLGLEPKNIPTSNFCLTEKN